VGNADEVLHCGVRNPRVQPLRVYRMELANPDDITSHVKDVIKGVTKAISSTGTKF
jgi:hypothetical protein